MKLGCHAVLFKERIKSETEAILKGIAETGFPGFEMGSRFFGTDDKENLLKLLEKYSLQLTALHTGMPLSDWIGKKEECMGKVADAAGFVKDMPNKNIMMSGGNIAEGDFDTIAANIEEAAKMCLDMGVKLNYHNHAHEFENDAKIFKALVKYAPSLYFGFDLGWVYKGGFDPVELVEAYAPRISYVHLRDAKERDTKEFCDLGEGIFDYPKLMGALNKVLGESGWAVVEYETGLQDFDRYKRAKAFLDSVKY